MSASKKALLKGKIPGEFKKRKVTHKVSQKTTPITLLNAADIKEIVASAKDDAFDFTNSALFQLDSDSFLNDKEFVEAKEVDLSGNCIKKFESGANLAKLKYLAIDSNSIVEFHFTGLKSLISLSASRNRIQNLYDMTDLSKLTYLDLSSNRITSGWPQLAKLKSLKVLDLGNCRIDLPPAEFNSLLLSHLKTLPKLQFLNLSGNPIETAFPEFKYFIIQELQELKYYNWDVISKEERAKAATLAQEKKWKDQSPNAPVAKKPIRARRVDTGTRRKNVPGSPGGKVEETGGFKESGGGSDVVEEGSDAIDDNLDLDEDINNDLEDDNKDLNDLDVESLLLGIDNNEIDEETQLNAEISNTIDEKIDGILDSSELDLLQRIKPTDLLKQGKKQSDLTGLLDLLDEFPSAGSSAGTVPSVSSASGSGIASIGEHPKPHPPETAKIPLATPPVKVSSSIPLKERDPWDAAESEFVPLDPIGKGTYGESKLGQWRRHEGNILIKKLVPDAPGSDLQSENEHFREECKRLHKLSNPCLVRLLGASVIDQDKLVFWEYFEEATTLQKYIKEKSPLQGKTILKFATSISIALGYLHQERIIHGALKSKNIMIANNEVKITDYGFMDWKDTVPLEEANPEYLAPELFDGDEYSEKIDIYSFAMVLYELVSAKLPFQGVAPNEVANYVMKKLRPNLPPGTPQAFSQLVQKCWAVDPFARPSFNNIKAILEAQPSCLPETGWYPQRPNSQPNVPPQQQPSTFENPNPTPFQSPPPSLPVQPNLPPNIPTSLPSNMPGSPPVYYNPPPPVIPVQKPKPPKPEVKLVSPPFHPSILSEEDSKSVVNVLNRLLGLIQTNITAHQIKALVALLKLSEPPGRILEVAKFFPIVQAFCSLLALEGQIGKFELVEQTISIITIFGTNSVMAEQMCLPQYRTLEYLVAILGSEDTTLIAKAAGALQTLVQTLPACADVLNTIGLLPRILQMLVFPNVQVQLGGLAALAAFLASRNNIITFAGTVGYQELDALTKSRISGIRLHAMELMMFFIVIPEIKPFIDPTKEIFLKSLVLKDKIVVAEHGIRALNTVVQLTPHNLSLSEKEYIFSNCLPFLETEQLALSTSRILKNLVCSAEQNELGIYVQFILSQNAFHYILPHLQSSSDLVRSNILELILCLLSIVTFKIGFINSLPVGVFNSTLNHWDPKIRATGLACVRIIIGDLSVPYIVDSCLIPILSSILSLKSNSDISVVADILTQIVSKEDKVLPQIFKDFGVTEALLFILGSPQDVTIQEPTMFALSALSKFDHTQHILVQDNYFTLILELSFHQQPNIADRASMILSNLAVNDYGCYLLANRSPIKLLQMLSSSVESVITSTLRILSYIIKKGYAQKINETDPSLSSLRRLENHPQASIRSVAGKLVEILNKK